MKPCIIISMGGQWHAYDFIAVSEDGRRMVAHRCYQTLRELMLSRGYTVVSHNSRIGRTILDKIEGRFIT